MSFTNETIKQTYIGDGVVTTFAIPFYNLASNPTFIEVYLLDAANAETLQVITTNYTLSPDSINPTNVVFVTPPTSTQRVLITRKLPLTQPSSFVNTGPFQKEDYEKAIDKLVMQVQQLNEKVDRAVIHSRGSGYSGKTLPVPTVNNILTWDGAGNIINTPVANFTNGTYTGVALAYNLFNLTSGTLNLDNTFSAIYCSGIGAKTINLPTTAAAGAGKILLFMSDGNSLVTTINRAGSDTIEGSTSFSMNVNYKWVMFVSDGLGTWHHNTPKQLEITSAMLATGAAGADKWLLTLGGVQTTGFTISSLTVGYYPCNTTAGSFTIVLPSAASCQGKVFTFENIGTANVLTIDGSGSQTIDGNLTQGILPGGTMTIVSDSSGWRITSFRSKNITVITSAVKTPAGNDQWHALTSNTFTLQPGLWEIDLLAFFSNGGSTPAYTYVATGLYGANGADSGVTPAALSTVSNLTVRSATISGMSVAAAYNSAASPNHTLQGGKYIVECTAVSGTISIVTYSTQTTAANARVTATATIKRIGG